MSARLAVALPPLGLPPTANHPEVAQFLVIIVTSYIGLNSAKNLCSCSCAGIGKATSVAQHFAPDQARNMRRPLYRREPCSISTGPPLISWQ